MGNKIGYGIVILALLGLSVYLFMDGLIWHGIFFIVIALIVLGKYSQASVNVSTKSER